MITKEQVLEAINLIEEYCSQKKSEIIFSETPKKGDWIKCLAIDNLQRKITIGKKYEIVSCSETRARGEWDNPNAIKSYRISFYGDGGTLTSLRDFRKMVESGYFLFCGEEK
jgi:hypothetical protein